MEPLLTFDLINIPKRVLELYSNPENLHKEAVPFVGHLRKHSQEEQKIFLRLDPLLQSSALLEFNKSDVLYAEDFKTIGAEGEPVSFRLVKIWVRKKAVAIRLEPFVVEDLSQALSDYDRL